MTFRRRTALAAALTFASLPCAASAAPSGPPIRLEAIVSTTGRYAVQGEPQRNAIQLAQQQINAAGGIGGRMLEIEIVDDEGKPEVASQLATQAVGRGVVGIVGATSNAGSAAIARVATEQKIPQIFLTPASEIWDTKNGIAKYVFETTPSNATEAPGLLEFAKRTGTHRAGILADENTYGAEGTKLLNALAKSYGIEIASAQTYSSTGTDFTAQLLQIKNANVDTIFVWGAATAPPLAVRGIRQLGLNVKVIGPTGIVSDQFLKVAGKDGEGVYSDTNLNYTHPVPYQRQFLDAYHAQFHARPANFAAYAYDAVQLFAYALRSSGGKTDADSVVRALETMKPLRLTTGTYRFTDKDHNGLKPIDVHIAVDRNQIWFNL
jgi:branched-chain amino acid transport system substrate-binding protein